ncbi:MAG: glycosyltransferase family 39 protein, partial [Actinomycetota bacterium]
MPPGSPKTSATTGPGSALPAGLQRQHLLLIFILLGAAVVRLYRLDQAGLWYDELYTVWASGLPLGDLVPEAMASGHPPLYYLLMHAWLVPESGDTWVLLLSALAGLATVWLTFLAGREMFSRQAGLWGAAFAAFSPLLVWYSREATMYSFLIALSLLSFYLLARCALRGGWKNWCGYVAATAAALMTSFLSPVLLAAQAPLYWLLRDGHRSRARHWFISQAALAAIALGIILMARTGTTEGWATWTGPSVPRVLNGIVRAPYVLAGGWIIEAAAGFPHPEMPDIPVWLLWLGAGLFLIVCAAAIPAVTGWRRLIVQKNTLAVAACTFILFVGPAVIL